MGRLFIFSNCSMAVAAVTVAVAMAVTSQHFRSFHLNRKGLRTAEPGNFVKKIRTRADAYIFQHLNIDFSSIIKMERETYRYGPVMLIEYFLQLQHMLARGRCDLQRDGHLLCIVFQGVGEYFDFLGHHFS